MVSLKSPKSRSGSRLAVTCGGGGVFVFSSLMTLLVLGYFLFFQVPDPVVESLFRKTDSPQELTQHESSTTSSQETSQSSNVPQLDFLEIAKKTGTDKVLGSLFLPACLKDPSMCKRPNCTNPKCRTQPAHFYDTMYNLWLGPWTNDEFQFLEIGYYTGKGFDAYSEFLPAAEKHTMEISCVSEQQKKEGINWPWGNFASENRRYDELRQSNRLHCGDASQFQFLNQVWTNHMKRPDAPPLKVVIDDGSHLSNHMAMTLFFWFPRIAPGGILVMEDIEPFPASDKFRTGVLPQVMYDMHYCGDPETEGKPCFPTIQPLLQSIHCEMHICVFERNNEPAWEPNQSQSSPPPHAYDATQCLLGKL